MIFKHSKLAHKYLGGLRGIEIGGAAHNPFGLNTLNVDRYQNMDTIYKNAEYSMCGDKMKVDIVAEGDQIPLPDKSYDFVISSHVIEHFYDPIRALKEWERIATKYIFIIVPQRNALQSDASKPLTTLDELIARHKENKIDRLDDHHSRWTCSSFVELCNYLNLNVIDVKDPDDKVGNGFCVVIKINDELNHDHKKEMSLHDIGVKYKTDKAINHNFLSFYETHLKQYRYKKIRLLEIGIGGIAHAKSIGGDSNPQYLYGGSSLRTWAEYFPHAEILGADIDESCLRYIYNTDRVKTIIGDQTDREFLNSIEGEFDIIIDDGGHTMQQQMITFGCLLKKLKKGGIYIIEDLHTSFMTEYGGNSSNENTMLSELHRLETSGKIDSDYLLPEEKKYIELNTDKIIINGFYDDINDKKHITSIIKNKLKINIYQIFYNDETKKMLDKSFIPYYNKSKDNYFENSVILDIYNKNIECDYIGITSPRFNEKTGMNGSQIIELVKTNIENDVIIYTPNYDFIYGRRIDIWKFNNNYPGISLGKSAIYKVAEILNAKKYLPFDIFEKDWTFCFCNYWIVKKEIFNDYVSNILEPTIKFMNTDEFKKQISDINDFYHRDKMYPVETFALEGLFGTYLSNNKYNVYNHFNK